ncbi:MAG: PIN domain-containing protein [Pseudomonadota bacterium]
MKTSYVLIDYENVQVKSLLLLQGGDFHVTVFLGPKNARLPVDLVLAMKDLGDKADYIRLETSSANALDFHITYYLGVLVADDPGGSFHIISKDTGFDSLIKHLLLKKIDCKRSISIEQMPCFAKLDTAPAPAPKTRAAAKAKKATAVAPVSVSHFEQLVEKASSDLIKRKKAPPGTYGKLLSTVHAKCGKSVPETEIEAVIQELIKRGMVKVEGTKVSYVFPKDAE